MQTVPLSFRKGNHYFEFGIFKAFMPPHFLLKGRSKKPRSILEGFLEDISLIRSERIPQIERLRVSGKSALTPLCYIGNALSLGLDK